MPKAPVPAAKAALGRAGLRFEQVDLVTTHNPFAVNDPWFAGPTGTRLIVFAAARAAAARRRGGTVHRLRRRRHRRRGGRPGRGLNRGHRRRCRDRRVDRGRIVVAVAWPKDADKKDQRDKEIYRFGEYIGQSFVVVGAAAALVLAMAEVDHFWIANAVYLAFVLSALLSSTAKIFAYRRGVPSW